VKQAFVFASVAAIRTLAQSMAAGLGTITVIATQWPDFKYLGMVVSAIAVGAVLSGLLAFFQNLAEQLKKYQEGLS
jgi:ABC-type Fe3+-siderophore transport system permease subunit